LTTTAYKYLDIRINVEPVSYVNIIHDDNRDNQPLLRETWTTLIEKRTDFERLLQLTSASSLWIHDLLVELIKIRCNDCRNCHKIYIK